MEHEQPAVRAAAFLSPQVPDFCLQPVWSLNWGAQERLRKVQLVLVLVNMLVVALALCCSLVVLAEPSNFASCPNVTWSPKVGRVWAEDRTPVELGSETLCVGPVPVTDHRTATLPGYVNR
jgi:hypothetical protein